MNGGYFFAWAASFFVLFFVTGWPVSPAFKNSWGNHYNAKNLAYYGVLYLHDLLGPLFFTFLFLGLLRNYIWKDNKGGNRQLAFLLSYSILVAAIFAVVLIHRYSPIEGVGVEDEEEIDVATADEDQEGATDDKT